MCKWEPIVFLEPDEETAPHFLCWMPILQIQVNYECEQT